MLPTSDRPEVTDEKQFANDFKKYDTSPETARLILLDPPRRSLKDFILDLLANIFEPVVERVMKRLSDKKIAALEKLKQDLDESWAKAPNAVKEYEESHKIKTLGKTINDLALWRAGTAQAKRGKSPKAKPVTRREGLGLERYKTSNK